MRKVSGRYALGDEYEAMVINRDYRVMALALRRIALMAVEAGWPVERTREYLSMLGYTDHPEIITRIREELRATKLQTS